MKIYKITEVVMCLYVDRKKTEEYKKRTEPILVWKWVGVGVDRILYSPIM